MSNDKTNWRDKVKSPTKTNEKMIGGDNSLQKKEEGIIDHNKIIQEGENRKIKPQEFDKELNAEKTNESFENRDKMATKDYENRMSEPNKIEPNKSNKKIFDRVDDLVDKVNQGVKKAVPYLDDTVKVIGEVGKVGGLAGGVVGFLNPESTAENDVFWKNEEEKRQYLEKQKQEQQILPESNLEKTQVIITNQDEREMTFSLMKDMEAEKPDFLKNAEPDIKKDLPALEIEDKANLAGVLPQETDGTMMTMKEFEEPEKPEFLKDIEPEPEKDIDHNPLHELTFYGDDGSDGSSDGGADGGADGGGDGGGD